MTVMPQNKSPYSDQIIVGVVFVVVGLALTLNNIGLLSVDLTRLWPLVIIGIGVNRMLNPVRGGRRERNGLWTVMIGTWLLFNTLGLLRWRDSWPLVIVAVGINIVWRALPVESRPAVEDSNGR